MAAVACCACQSLLFGSPTLELKRDGALGFRDSWSTRRASLGDLSHSLRRVSPLRHQLEINRARPRNNLLLSQIAFIQATVQNA
jgi:hypothetical protein